MRAPVILITGLPERVLDVLAASLGGTITRDAAAFPAHSGFPAAPGPQATERLRATLS